jgi:hypothetical protein
MHHGEPPDPRFSRDENMLADFPGPVAIPAEPVRGLAPLVSWEHNNGEPWAVAYGYALPRQHLLTVRTVRSREGLNPYGLAVESLASSVVNHLAMDDSSRPDDLP